MSKRRLSYEQVVPHSGGIMLYRQAYHIVQQFILEGFLDRLCDVSIAWPRGYNKIYFCYPAYAVEQAPFSLCQVLGITVPALQSRDK